MSKRSADELDNPTRHEGKRVWDAKEEFYRAARECLERWRAKLADLSNPDGGEWKLVILPARVKQNWQAKKSSLLIDQEWNYLEYLESNSDPLVRYANRLSNLTPPDASFLGKANIRYIINESRSFVELPKLKYFGEPRPEWIFSKLDFVFGVGVERKVRDVEEERFAAYGAEGYGRQLNEFASKEVEFLEELKRRTEERLKRVKTSQQSLAFCYPFTHFVKKSERPGV